MLLTPDANQVREYSLPNDTDPKTVFLIGSIDAAHLAKIIDSTEGQDEVDIYTRCLQLAQFGLKGWSNLGNEQGDAVVFDAAKHISSINVPEIGIRKALNTEALELLKPYLIVIGGQVYRQNTLSPEQIKNLSTPSR